MPLVCGLHMRGVFNLSGLYTIQAAQTKLPYRPWNHLKGYSWHPPVLRSHDFVAVFVCNWLLRLTSNWERSI